MSASELVIAKATDLMEMDVAKSVWQTLMKHYPGYWWAVTTSGGMVQVRNLDLSGDWGFNIHTTKAQEDTSGKIIRDAGGEILERYRVHRGFIKHEQIDELPRDFAGRIAFDKTGARHAG